MSGAFPTGVGYVNAVAVGTTLLNVYVAVDDAWFPNASLTHHVLVCVHGCCGLMSIPVVVFHVLPSKLYGVVCNHINASVADVIANVPVSHSFPLAFANVNVGAVISTCIVADDTCVE